MSAIDVLKEELQKARDEVKKLEEAVRVLSGSSKIYMTKRKMRTNPKRKGMYEEGKKAPDILLEIMKNNVTEVGADFNTIAKWSNKFVKMPKGTVSSSLYELKKAKKITRDADGNYRLAG